MAGLMQLLLDTVDAGIDDVNYQKIQHLKVNEILLEQTNNVIDKEKNQQNQDLVDAISNERHANAAKVNKELGRDFLIDFDSNAFIKKVNGQIIGKIKEFGNFSSEVVADLYTKSVLELTMQIANGGIDTIERIANNNNQGISEIVSTSFNIAKNTPSFYKYETNTEILNGLKSEALVTGVLIAGYANLTPEEKDSLWENVTGLPPEQIIQLYEAEISDSSFQDGPDRTEEEKIFNKSNKLKFRFEGAVFAYKAYKGKNFRKEDLDMDEFVRFVQSDPSFDPELIEFVSSEEFYDFISEEFKRIYDSSPAEGRNTFKIDDSISEILHLVVTGKAEIGEDGKLRFLDLEAENKYSPRIDVFNQALSEEGILNNEDLRIHYDDAKRSQSGYSEKYKKNKIDRLNSESYNFTQANSTNQEPMYRTLEILKKNKSFDRMQESTSFSEEDLSKGLHDFIDFIQTTEEDVLQYISKSKSKERFYEIFTQFDENFFDNNPCFKTIVESIGIEKVQEYFADPEKRKEWLKGLSEISPSLSQGPITKKEEPALDPLKEDMYVAPIPDKSFYKGEASKAKAADKPINSLNDIPNDTSTSGTSDSAAPKVEDEVTTSMVVSNTAIKSTTRTGFWSNFMRHMREDKESKGLFGKIRSAFRKAREDSDIANGFAVAEDSSNTASASEGTTQNPEEQTFEERYRFDTSQAKQTSDNTQQQQNTSQSNDGKRNDPDNAKGDDEPEY